MSKTVIQIDADATVGQLVTSILGPKGYELEQISSGKTALDKIKEKPYDICMVGDQLDDLDGIGFLVQLRKANNKIKVVMVTKNWPASELYERLTKDLKVDLVAIRPLKASIFGAQVDSLLETGKEAKRAQLTAEELHFEAIQALKSKYIIVLPERIKKLTESFDAARAEHSESRYLEEAIRLAHNLKGTSGSCGLIELSEASAHLESALKAMMASGLYDNETSWDEVQNFLDYVVQVANVIASSKESEASDVSSRLKNLSHGMTPPTSVDEGTMYPGGVYVEPGNSAASKSINPFLLDGVSIDAAAAKAMAKPGSNLAISGGGGAPAVVPQASGLLLEPGMDERLLPLTEDPTSIRVLIMSSEAVPNIERQADGLPVKIIPTSNFDDALHTAKNLALDAVLIDIDTGSPAPGITLARTIRGLPGNENLPVAFVSTSLEPSNPVESAHAGASLYLEKPVKLQMLSNAVDYLLSVRTGGRPRILIIDDDEDFVRLVGAILGKEGMIVKGLTLPENVVEHVLSFAPDIVLLDVMMPGISGYQICQQMREQPQWQDLPVLFLTAQTGLSARLAAFEAGGDDYLPKPVAPAELLMRVKVRLERARMLKERADKDVLTGLMIRRAFMEQLQALFSESRNNNLRFSICLLDIDHFKKVNDTYGHLAGDRVLTYFGALIRRRFRVEDLRGRWGGEEFIVAFRHIEKETAQGALERCLEELKAHVFEGDNGGTFSVSFSAGLVSFPEDGDNPQALIKLADECLYEAKRNGRSQVVAANLKKKTAETASATASESDSSD
jgi:diguanylate cyclase (GGDEF)-like protein